MLRANPHRIVAEQGIAYLALRGGREVIVDVADLFRVDEGHWRLTRAKDQLYVRGLVAGKFVVYISSAGSSRWHTRAAS